jgi:uncharacterized repeat protein (TIGR03847 family)
MSQSELSPEVFTAGYIGRPGRRAFYLQVRGPFGAHSYPIEKQQVAVLSEKLRELLLLVDADDTIGTAVAGRDPALDLEAPADDDWRIGTIGLAYEEDSDRVVVLIQSATGMEEEVEEPEETHRLLLRRDQVRAFILHTDAVVAEGRPICQLCGLPMDPEGHQCPASNGHRQMA